MKKLMTITLALVMALSLSAIPAFAGEKGVDDLTGESSYTNQKDAAKETTIIIPAFGYTGEDAIVSHDVADDADDEGDISVAPVYEINVTVPVKVIWAAFKSDNNDIAAPDYHISNNSTFNDLKVTLVKFTAKAGSEAENTAVDKDRTLNLKSSGEHFGDTVALIASGSSAEYKYTDGTSPFGNSLAKKDTWNFSFGGTYGSEPSVFDEPHRPQYDMQLKFAVDDTRNDQ